MPLVMGTIEFNDDDSMVLITARFNVFDPQTGELRENLWFVRGQHGKKITPFSEPEMAAALN